jgi:branched-chain amino acid aminotransferase
MKGLMMPEYPAAMFEKAVAEVVRRNKELGFAPEYDKAWEKDGFQSGHAVYVRPFSYSEPAIGLGVSNVPWVIVVSTPVGSYFDTEKPQKAVTSSMARATPGGTGWIKCDANYVISILAKKRAEKAGYMEAIFLDSREHRFVEEGSSCNIFFSLKDGTLVTPSLEDRVLPGITRKSIITLAEDRGITVQERPVAIDEVMADAVECFVTGTAAGVAHIESITHDGTEAVFNNRKIGEVTRALQWELKGIQYGAVEDRHGWMRTV